MKATMTDKMFLELQREAYAIRDARQNDKASKEVFEERFMWNKDFVEKMTNTTISLKNWELVVEEQ